MSVSESLRSSEPGSNVGVRWNPVTSHLPTQSIAANLPNSWNEAVTPAASFGKGERRIFIATLWISAPAMRNRAFPSFKWDSGWEGRDQKGSF